MNPPLDIAAAELATYAAQARYLAVAARSIEQGPPVDQLERENCVLYLLEVIEDLSARAEHAADRLRAALEGGA